MKIEETYQNTGIMNNANESAVIRKAEDQKEQAQAAEKERNSLTTEVEFSKTSVEFSRAAEMMGKEPPERTEKVNEITAKVREGTYSVDSSSVADKIIKDSLANLVEP